MNGKYLERFGKTWGTKAKHATAHGGGVRCLATTISCTKILPSWPNEAKNSCVLRQLISVIMRGAARSAARFTAPAARIYRACSTPPRNAAVGWERPRTFRSSTSLLNVRRCMFFGRIGGSRHSVAPSLSIRSFSCWASKYPSPERGAAGTRTIRISSGVENRATSGQRRQHRQRRSPRHLGVLWAIAPCAGRSMN
jgi:hypothetical protein